MSADGDDGGPDRDGREEVDMSRSRDVSGVAMTAAVPPKLTALQRVTRLSDRLFDRLRHKRAFSVTDGTTVPGDLSSLRASKYAVLVTFRRSGAPVPSPVWFGLDDDGHAFVKTTSHAGKVQRLRRDGRAVIAASTRRGNPRGPAIQCTARVLAPEEWPRAEAALATAYGAGRKTFERMLGGADTPAYIEISAGR